mmetsp:Transcript_77542/g.122052  ORF Transcript_77542/g.122052 Transcript_77542/m.122052 type:complete len:690 (+) Transcript_77542:3-2072(+)
MTNDNISLTETVQKHESEKLQGEVEITNLRDMLNAKRTEAERELRRRERLEKELQELKQSLESRSKNLRAIQNGIKEQEDLKDVHDKALKEQRFLVEQLNEKEEKILEEIEKLKRDTRNEEERRKKLHEENLELGKEYKAKAEEMKACQQEKDKAQKAFDQLKRKKALEDDERHEIEMSRGVLRSDTENLIREIDQLKKQVEVDSKAVAEIMRERETLYRSVLRTAGRTTSQSELVKNHDARTQSLEKDVTRVKEDLQNAIKRVYELDKTREKYGIELSLANSKHMAALEELKNRDNKISELKKNHADVKGKLAQQKQAYEAVRTERNLFSKNLVESQDEIAEMKRKFKIMYHQIEQLKEEIKEKDQALIKEHWDHTRMHKQCENIKDQMEKAKKKQQHLQGQKETQLSEIKKLESRLQEAEVERNSQKRKYEEIISERDILGTQLIRRNDELALLYEKIKIQQRTLQGGEIAYKQRLEESRALAIRTAALKRELLIAGRKVSDIDEIKREVFQLQRELLRERTKVKALSEELENPLNVHRWRKLEGTDPAMYETMQKVKTLQKRLISKTEEAVEKDLAIQEKEKLYLEMRNLLQKQPGPEIVEEVAKQQQSLKEKTKGMKAMAAELNMYHAQLNDYKDEIERLTKELQDTKRRYFEQRRREQLLQDTSRTEKDRAARTQETQAAQSRG